MLKLGIKITSKPVVTKAILEGQDVEKIAKKNKFDQAFYEFFKNKDGDIDIFGNRYKLTHLEKYPKGLDLENFEIFDMGGDYVTFIGGGDWQDMVKFTVAEKSGKLIIGNLYSSERYNSLGAREVGKRIKGIEEKYKHGEVKKSLGILIRNDSGEIEKSFGESFGGWDDIEKALSHKYIRRIPKKNGKGWWYVYAETFKKPFNALKEIFGLKQEKLDDDYKKHDIEKQYGADKQTFAAHVLEYLSNRLKWNSIFSKKENRQKYEKPVKQADVTAESSNVKNDAPAVKDKTPAVPQEKPSIVVNRSLMKKVWEIYNPIDAEAAKIQDKTVDEPGNQGDTVNIQGAENAGKDNTGTGRSGLSVHDTAVRSGRSEGSGDLDVPGAGSPDGQGTSGIVSNESRERFGERIPERRGRRSLKDVRAQVKELLSKKTDDQMTEDDKNLLRQYEGAGGLAEEGASTHGTLYEFYTPQKVVDKVWSLVDKYKPQTDKTVIEPSAGTGRFAEGRPEKFNLFELDETSARIAGILHPEADVKQGAFQELFMNGRTPKKKYDGKIFDVAVGNPPYGAYTGLYKGMGEGKEHTRIDEYFLDRSLDTLKDGGILAMVVPSSFLRGKNSNAKEQIAGKGKLLEAWRLPNGTFGTTGVGTDIIILRKEKGDSAAFSDNSYFEVNEGNIIGNETDRIGRFGLEKYVGLPDGMDFDEALDTIDPAKVPVTQGGEKSEQLIAEQNIEVKEGEAEAHENRSRAMEGNENAAGDRGGQTDEAKGKKADKNTFTPSIGKNMTAEEYNEKYGILVDKKDFPVWKATDYDGRIEVGKLSESEREHLQTSGNFTVDAAGNWYSIANYASGNIYDKLEQLEKDREALGEKNYQVNKSLLEAVRPEPKKADNISVSPISDFAKEYIVHYGENREENLRMAFFSWAKLRWGNLADDSPISQFEIPKSITFQDVVDYINQKSLRSDKATARESGKETALMEKAQKRDARRECAERLFNRFIREGMTDEQRKALEETWNKRYNATVNPDYSKIPILVEGMNTNKGKKVFTFLQPQVAGVSFLSNKGNGILAHEVGIGKTSQGIAATVNQINTGRAKKPLICVPKAVYSKWVREIKQHFPDIQVNELGNLSEKSIASYKNGDKGLNIPEGTLSVCTFEALSNITFKDETIDGQLRTDIMDSQTIYDDDAIQDKKSQKKLADEQEKIMEMLGQGSKAKENALFWENTGFDHITVDEIHGFKNVFKAARAFGQRDEKGKEENLANEFTKLTGGTPSDRAVKLFAITQLIQKQNNGRNVFGLSATPFTNSPIEVYNILSLVAREKLKELRIFNMHEFMTQFAEIKTEWSVDQKGEIIEKEVMKNWKNLGALQNLIHEYMDYVTADEAGVMRPRKRLKLPQIEMTGEQKEIAKKVIEYMTNADPKEDPGATLKGINALRSLALSPALVDGLEIGDETIKLKNKDFVKSSPKMTFVCESVARQYKEQPTNSQIIYLPRGTSEFSSAKAYLVSKGMPPESIAFMSGATSQDARDRITKDFNDPNGKIKVVIGSEAIKEGVSLNGNTTTLYNCMLGWNPTETTQVEGRLWRQGNKQGHVHIIYPLMADSIDSLMYQKYDEKKSRIDEIWSYKGDRSNDISDINPEELKFDLIKDPAKKASFRVGLEKEKVASDQRIEEARYEVLFKDSQNLNHANNNLPEARRDFDEAEAEMKEQKTELDSLKKELEKRKKEKAETYRIKEVETDIEQQKWRYEKAQSTYRRERDYVKEIQGTIDGLQAKFKRQGIKPGKVDDRLKEIAANIQRFKAEVERINKNYTVYLEQAKRELKAASQKLPPVQDLIDQNVKAIMSDLKPMDVVKEELKKERAINKSFVFKFGKFWMKTA
ncbi:hypothetical protein AGMMS50268_17090 [Spirochaetia bacterium]|nr:hypothetical protein AGMMS50268_17090 [Spirochaetia bacterium]